VTSNASVVNVKTSKCDYDLLKSGEGVELKCRHGGWVWSAEKETELRVALFGCSDQYYPQKDDYVIVVVSGKTNDNYFCSLGSGTSYVLSALDFEGATKKNRPNLAVGSLVYARVIETSGCLRGRISCINPKSKKEWITGEGLFGELSEGLCVDVPLHFTNHLLSKQKKPQFFKELSKHATFEVCLGRNGKIWIKCASMDHSILITNLMRKASTLDEVEQLNLIK
jgi:exosome complex component RRP40